MIRERASGTLVYQLDLFMSGEENCRALLREAAQQADTYRPVCTDASDDLNCKN